MDGSRRIDLNADLGEAFGPWPMGDDAALLALVSSANVACGFHAGDPLTAATTCRRAGELGVAIGAHVGYRDLVGFGRRFIDVDPTELTAEVVYQVGALSALAAAAGTAVRHVKPHGALYTALGHHHGQAAAVVEAVMAVDPSLLLFAPPGSLVADLADRAGLRVVGEAFADRAYTAAGTLVPRREQGAVLHDPDEIADRVLQLVTDGTVTSVDGHRVAIEAGTVCLHGDTPGAVASAVRVRAVLAGAGVVVAAP